MNGFSSSGNGLCDMTPGGMSWLRKDSIPLRELHTGLGFCFTLDRIFVRLVCLWVGIEDREHESCDCWIIATPTPC